MRHRSRVAGALLPGLAALALGACAPDSDSTTGPEPADLAKRGTGLKVTPARLAFTAAGATGTLTASTSAPGGLTATVSTPACATVTPRRLTRSPGKFTVTATAPGACTITIADGGGSVAVPVQVTALLQGTVVTGGYHTCGLISTGAAYCWGSNEYGQLGTTTNSGVDGPNPSPLTVQGNLTFVRLTAGQTHTCGLTATGVAYCWGANDLGQLGITANTETATPNPSPTAVSTTETFVDLKAGRWFTCGLKSDGSVLCWGSNQWGQLGTEVNVGGVSPNPTPNLVPGGNAFARLSVGDSHVCGLTAAGVAYCWGRNNFGQLGTDLGYLNGDGVTTPQAVRGTLTFASLALGGTHTCGVTPAGATYCWGNNDRGELGTSEQQHTGLGVYDPLPVENTLAFTALTAGKEHTCGLVASGDAYCWGRNFQGELGSMTDFFSETPTALLVDGGLAFIQVASFATHTCGVTATGAAYCWGDNLYGQLGTTTNSGTGTPTPTPTAVSGGLTFGIP